MDNAGGGTGLLSRSTRHTRYRFQSLRRGSQAVQEMLKSSLNEKHLVPEHSIAALLLQTSVAFSVMVSVLLVTFQAAFHSGIVWQWCVIYTMDLFYVAYIVSKFFTTYSTKGTEASALEVAQVLEFFISKKGSFLHAVPPPPISF